MFLTIFLAIVDTRSCLSMHPSKRRLSQTALCLVRRLGCVIEHSGTDISHTLSFYFPNVIGLVQRIVRFVMHTEPKASSRTVQYEYAYRYTCNIYTVYPQYTVHIKSPYMYMCIYIQSFRLLFFLSVQIKKFINL